MNKSFCVIPARSGSKGLVDKNILTLHGKPVLSYTIDACIETGLFDTVYVMTDSEEYKSIAEECGASVPYLEPAELAEDHISSTEPVLWLAEKLGITSASYDYIWCMQPTSPLRTSDDITKAYETLESDPRCDFVLGVTPIDPHYFHWALEAQDDGMCEMYFGREFLRDRSELFTVYRPNGAIKVGRFDKVCQFRNFFGDNIKCVEMPEERSIHIRSQLDFDICELLLRGDA